MGYRPCLVVQVEAIIRMDPVRKQHGLHAEKHFNDPASDKVPALAAAK